MQRRGDEEARRGSVSCLAGFASVQLWLLSGTDRPREDVASPRENGRRRPAHARRSTATTTADHGPAAGGRPTARDAPAQRRAVERVVAVLRLLRAEHAEHLLGVLAAVLRGDAAAAHDALARVDVHPALRVVDRLRVARLGERVLDPFDRALALRERLELVAQLRSGRREGTVGRPSGRRRPLMFIVEKGRRPATRVCHATRCDPG